jgi:hypothetical protein
MLVCQHAPKPPEYKGEVSVLPDRDPLLDGTGSNLSVSLPTPLQEALNKAMKEDGYTKRSTYIAALLAYALRAREAERKQSRR